MTMNFKPEEEEKFQPHNRWYNVHIQGFQHFLVLHEKCDISYSKNKPLVTRDFSIHAIYLYHLAGIWYFCKNLDFYRNRFDQAGFPIGGLLALLVPAISFIALFCIWERNLQIFMYKKVMTHEIVHCRTAAGAVARGRWAIYES